MMTIRTHTHTHTHTWMTTTPLILIEDPPFMTRSLLCVLQTTLIKCYICKGTDDDDDDDHDDGNNIHTHTYTHHLYIMYILMYILECIGR